MLDNAIEVKNLSHRYGQIQALDDVSFTIEAGEVFGFLGPNGAGKTTTLRILTGQLRPTSGQARVAGCDVVSERDLLKPRIGVVFEHQNLYERLSARENLAFSAGLYGTPRKNIKDVLALVGLDRRAGDPLKTYSNGMKQRLLIGRALLHKPQVLFLDEPTRGLDPNISREIRSLVAALGQQGVTIFLTTHYMEEADRLCRRVAILDRGRIVALDEPGRLKAADSLGDGATLEDVFVHLTGRSFSEEPVGNRRV